MKSKTFASYYFLFVLATFFLLIISVFILKDVPHVGLFGPGIIPLAILFNPVYIGWGILSFLLYLISRSLEKEEAFEILNWILLGLPFIIGILFYFFIIF